MFDPHCVERCSHDQAWWALGQAAGSRWIGGSIDAKHEAWSVGSCRVSKMNKSASCGVHLGLGVAGEDLR